MFRTFYAKQSKKKIHFVPILKYQSSALLDKDHTIDYQLKSIYVQPAC